ncbi:hypothetical protein FGIG_09215 [Fasciola gigantica]|uniref:Paraneoplastic antigen Ma-like C-terminal domain-containing protein n=2 Tax=Fasciola gigantica TaxID=46835 RepID=A0A504Z144_FASGI|nr:hypothetical protein FGIG_09215 [Fasciola gigantica]
MPKKSSSSEEESEQSFSVLGSLGQAITKILTLLSSVVTGGSVRTRTTPSIPPPEKFCLGGNFRRWAADAEDYIEAFPPNERRRALLSLLDGEAKDIARDSRILDEEITAATFARLRHYLTEEPDIMTVRLQFQSRIQLTGETLSEFVRGKSSEIWPVDAFHDLGLGGPGGISAGDRQIYVAGGGHRLW